MLLLTLLVPAYGALLLVAAEGGGNRLLLAVAVGISITQAAVLSLVLRPSALPLSPSTVLLGVGPPLLASLAIRATLVRQASLGARWATAGVAWLVTLGPLFLFL